MATSVEAQVEEVPGKSLDLAMVYLAPARSPSLLCDEGGSGGVEVGGGGRSTARWRWEDCSDGAWSPRLLLDWIWGGREGEGSSREWIWGSD